MQAIETRYLPATDHKPARVRAICAAGSIIVPYDYDAPHGEGPHLTAALALCAKLGWNEVQLVSGAVPSNPKGYVFCLIPKRNPYNVCEVAA